MRRQVSMRYNAVSRHPLFYVLPNLAFNVKVYHISHYAMNYVGVRLPILTHWGRLTLIRVCKLNFGSDNGLLLAGRQTIIWTHSHQGLALLTLS